MEKKARMGTQIKGVRNDMGTWKMSMKITRAVVVKRVFNADPKFAPSY